MNKIAIATFNFNNNEYTNDIFLPTLFSNTPQINECDVYVVDTGNQRKFTLCNEFVKYQNVKTLHISDKVGDHPEAIQYIIDLFQSQYDDLLIFDNDVIIKKDPLPIIDHEYFSVGTIQTYVTDDNIALALFFVPRILPFMNYINLRYVNSRILYNCPGSTPYDSYSNNKYISINTQLLSSFLIDDCMHDERQFKCFADTGAFFYVWSKINCLPVKHMSWETMYAYIEHQHCGTNHINIYDDRQCIERYQAFLNKAQHYL